jgi:hypothetical protein
MAKRPTMLAILHEHNILNGFRFVLIEFTLVAVVALLVGATELIHGRVVWAFGYLGIAENAGVICATAIGQMSRRELSHSNIETFFGKGRDAIRREHPHLDRHTLAIVVATLVPFLLAGLTIIDR